MLGLFSLIYHHSCEHYSKDYVTKYVNKDSSFKLFVAVCERKDFAKVSVTLDLCQRKIARENTP